MIVSFSSFSLLAIPVEIAASFAWKKKRKEKNMRMILDSSENLQKHWAQQTTGISNSIHTAMGDYTLSICEVTGIQEELVGFKWDNKQFSLKRQNDIDLYNKSMWKVLI